MTNGEGITQMGSDTTFPESERSDRVTALLLDDTRLQRQKIE